jgi:hypothetical protein
MVSGDVRWERNHVPFATWEIDEERLDERHYMQGFHLVEYERGGQDGGEVAMYGPPYHHSQPTEQSLGLSSERKGYILEKHCQSRHREGQGPDGQEYFVP